jgi:hypothetical protein
MSECCNDCKEIEPYRLVVLERLEELKESINLRPGSADCDVNPLNVNGPHWAAARRHLDAARDSINEFFDTLKANRHD